MRPDSVFDDMLQHERTTLAWERTAFSVLVVGALMARVGGPVHPLLGAVGLLVAVAGAGLLIWTGRHYEELHGPLRQGDSPVHPKAVAVVGIGATVATVAATLVWAAAVFIGD